MSRVSSLVARALAAVVLASATACSSAPALIPSPEGSAAVTVVGWSLRTQSPLAIKGVLRSDGTPITFDTQSAPAGKTFESLTPGAYRVEVTHRYSGERLVAATGLERVDVRPGERARVEVVVDDRDDESSQ